MAGVSSFDAARFLLEMTIKSAGIVSIVWLMTALWRSSAALRHALWLAAFFALLLLPAFSILLPPLSFVSGLSGIFEGAVSLYDGEAAVKSPPGLSPVPSQINSDPPGSPLAGKLDGILASSHSGTGSSRLYPFLLGLWLAGLIASLSGLVLDYRSRRRWLADVRCVTSGLWADIAAELERNGLVRRPIRILVSPRIPVPVTWGFHTASRGHSSLGPDLARRPDQDRTATRGCPCSSRRPDHTALRSHHHRLLLVPSDGLARLQASAPGAREGVR